MEPEDLTRRIIRTAITLRQNPDSPLPSCIPAFLSGIKLGIDLVLIEIETEMASRLGVSFR